MGIEGDRWLSFERKNPENPFGRGIEPRGNQGVEGSVEREFSWLSQYLSPELIEKIGQYSAFEGSSNEWLIYQRLLGVLVETGPGLDPSIRVRLRNLVGVLRLTMYQNLKPQEQHSIDEWSQATTFDVRSLTYEINTEVTEDIRWIWGTFSLEVPTGRLAVRLLGEKPVN